MSEMDLLKGVTSKLVSGIIAASVIALAISWWRADDETRQMLLDGAGKIAAWFGVVIAMPWASFFVIGRVARLDSNTAGAAFVLGLTLLEALLLAWLFGWRFTGAT